MNKARLRYEMAIRNISVAKLCETIGIAIPTFYQKCNGRSEFTRKEIQDIVNFLGLETPVGIFFDIEVSNKAN